MRSRRRPTRGVLGHKEIRPDRGTLVRSDSTNTSFKSYYYSCILTTTLPLPAPQSCTASAISTVASRVRHRDPKTPQCSSHTEVVQRASAAKSTARCFDCTCCSTVIDGIRVIDGTHYETYYIFDELGQ